MGTQVAVKRLPGLPEEYPYFTEVMYIASTLRHPNILQFMGATRVGPIMILNEYIPMCTTLSEQLMVKHLQNTDIINISRDVVSALNYLHFSRSESILHRDIRPKNVFLEQSLYERWKGKLSNFGSASTVSYTHLTLPTKA